MLKPVLHIYYSTSAKIFESMLAIVPGITIAGLVFLFPPMAIMFGLPVALLLFIGLKSLWECVKNPVAVALDKSGLRIIGVSDVLAWKSIDKVEGSTVLGKIPFRILNIHLKKDATSTRISPKFVQAVGNIIGLQSKYNIKLGNLAIDEGRLIGLINDYRSNQAEISDSVIVSISEKDMRSARRLINWSSSAFVVVIFIWLLASLSN